MTRKPTTSIESMDACTGTRPSDTAIAAVMKSTSENDLDGFRPWLRAVMTDYAKARRDPAVLAKHLPALADELDEEFRHERQIARRITAQDPDPDDRAVFAQWEPVFRWLFARGRRHQKG